MSTNPAFQLVYQEKLAKILRPIMGLKTDYDSIEEAIGEEFVKHYREFSVSYRLEDLIENLELHQWLVLHEDGDFEIIHRDAEAIKAYVERERLISSLTSIDDFAWDKLSTHDLRTVAGILKKISK